MSNEKLTPLQQRNLAALKLKKELLSDQFGNKIVILDTEEDVLNMDGVLAMPLSELDRDASKQLIMKCAVVVEDERTGERYLKYSADETPVADDTEDVMVAMRRTMELLEKRQQSIIENAKIPRKSADAVISIPKGYKLVKIDDDTATDEVIDNSQEAPAEDSVEQVPADMGKLVKPKRGKKKNAVKQMLLELLSEFGEDDED